MKLNGQQWERVLNIVDRTFNLPTEERVAYLEETCANQPELLREVEALLAADGNQNSVLDQGLFSKSISMEDIGRPGDEIAGYRLVREVGHGGMGVVFLGEPVEDGYQRQVAIKILASAQNSADALRDFQKERQILASLAHPNIAKLFESGIAPNGAPYMIMAYIAGEPLDIYCDRNQLTIRQRLELFVKICGAVGFAHRNLVVHSDLKPSNILVDQDGEPQLLDFGIAQMLKPETLEPYTMTAGMVMLTPKYAAPEQIKGQPIGTACDIYVLGLLLYQLLCGSHPYQVDSANLVQVVCEETPPSPGSRISSALDVDDLALTQILDSRQVGGRELARQLKGDLNHIVMKALRKEPGARYQSANLLQQDLQNHLDGYPIQARKDHYLYILGKFLRRNWLAVTGFVLFMGVLITSSALLFLQQEDLIRQRDTAQTVTRFLVDVFKGGNPARVGGRELTARELLDQGRKRLAGDLKTKPHIRASMMATIGEVYLEMTMYDEALAQFNNALEIQIGLLDEKDGDLLHTLKNKADALANMDRLDEAERIMRNVLEKRVATPENSAQLAGEMMLLATILRIQGQYGEAITLNEKSLTLARRFMDVDNPALWDQLTNLGYSHRERGDYQLAVKYYGEALDYSLAYAGENNPVTLSLLNNMAIVLSFYDLNQAEAMQERALKVGMKILAEEHHLRYKLHNNMGRIYLLKNEMAPAEIYFRKALEIALVLLSKGRPYFATLKANLARVLYETRRYEESETLLNEATTIIEKLHIDHPDRVYIFQQKSILLLRTQQYKEALTLCEEALRIAKLNYSTENEWLKDLKLLRLKILARMDGR